jgi:diketogulonate reductase-like aldo/keto reductase
VFITSKIDPGEQGYNETKRATARILQDLGTKYVDLMLVHWPGVLGEGDKIQKRWME